MVGIPQGWMQFPDGSIGPRNSVGSDWNAPYRNVPGIPQGWMQFPDGSIGPRNSVGSDWNAPYRNVPGVPGGPPAGVGPGGALPGGAQLPGSVGGGTYPYSSTTPGTPGMGFPAIESSLSGQPGGSEIIPPQNRTIPSGKQVGAWTNPFTEAHIDPTTGQPEMLTGPDGIAERNRAAFNPASLIRKGGFWPTLIESTLYPTPAETGEYNPPMITGRPDAPWNTTHGLPAPAAAPQRGMPWPDTGVAPAGGTAPMPARPVTPTPATVYSPTAAAAAAAPGRNPFTWEDRPNADVAGGALSRGGPPKMSMLDLSGLFGGGQPASAAPAATQPRTKSKIPPTAQAEVPPQASGPMDPSIIARQRKRRFKGSSSSQGGGS